MFKQKRAFTGEGATSAAAGTSIQPQPQTAQVQQQPQMPAMGAGQVTTTTPQEEALIEMPIEEALQKAETMQFPDFILMV